jgi:hypothetical protein
VQWSWHHEVSESIVRQVLLWLWNGYSSGTQKIEHPPLEAGARGLVMDSRPRGRSACSEKQRQTACNSNIAL